MTLSSNDIVAALLHRGTGNSALRAQPTFDRNDGAGRAAHAGFASSSIRSLTAQQSVAFADGRVSRHVHRRGDHRCPRGSRDRDRGAPQSVHAQGAHLRRPGGPEWDAGGRAPGGGASRPADRRGRLTGHCRNSRKSLVPPAWSRACLQAERRSALARRWRGWRSESLREAVWVHMPALSR
jgi:hypothetical protein